MHCDLSTTPPVNGYFLRLPSDWCSGSSGGAGRPASPGEREAAKECLDLYGFDLATQLLPRVVKRMRQQFPEAKTFGAVRPYFAEVHAEHVKREQVAETVKAAHLRSHLEDEEERQRERRHEQLDAVWQSLPVAERQSIEDAVMARNSRLHLSKFPGLLHRLCLDELAKRQRVS
jgi:hypothetical protein